MEVQATAITDIAVDLARHKREVVDEQILSPWLVVGHDPRGLGKVVDRHRTVNGIQVGRLLTPRAERFAGLFLARPIISYVADMVIPRQLWLAEDSTCGVGNVVATDEQTIRNAWAVAGRLLPSVEDTYIDFSSNDLAPLLEEATLLLERAGIEHASDRFHVGYCVKAVVWPAHV